MTNICTFIISSWTLPRNRNVSDRSCIQNDTRVYSSISFFPKIVLFMRKCGRISCSRTAHIWQYNTDICFACRNPKATIPHSEYVFIIIYQRQKLLRERDLVLRYKWTACFIIFQRKCAYSAVGRQSLKVIIDNFRLLRSLPHPPYVLWLGGLSRVLSRTVSAQSTG